jgi:hypothetical protein
VCALALRDNETDADIAVNLTPASEVDLALSSIEFRLLGEPL